MYSSLSPSVRFNTVSASIFRLVPVSLLAGTPEDLFKPYQLEAYREGHKAKVDAIEVNHYDNANWEFPIRYTIHKTGNPDIILMLGRDLRPIAEMQQQLVKAQMALERDYEAQREFDTRFRVLLDAVREAVVFVNLGTGRIADANKPAAEFLGVERVELFDWADSGMDG